jgi:hypothetical protein
MRLNLQKLSEIDSSRQKSTSSSTFFSRRLEDWKEINYKVVLCGRRIMWKLKVVSVDNRNVCGG